MENKVREKLIYIDGSPIDYTVTEDGKVYSLNYRRTGKKRELKPNRTRTTERYVDFQVSLFINGIQYRKSVRRLVAEAFLPNPNHLPYVTCANGNFCDIRLSNLMWTDKACENQPSSIYASDTIHSVCKDLESGKLTLNEIGEKYGITYRNIRNIIYGNKWAKISKNYNIQNYKKTRKLEKEIIIAICEALQNGEGAYDIARKLNVSIMSVYDIKNRKRYEDVSKDYDF